MCPQHGYDCPATCPVRADAAMRSSQPRIWETTLQNGTTLVGVTGDGTHTHIGSTFVAIKDERTGRHPFVWKLPLSED